MAAMLRDVVFRTCSAAGLLLGLLWSVNRDLPEAANCVGNCVGEAFIDSLVRYLTPPGLGLILGAAVGVVIARQIRERRPTRDVQPGRWITARYPDNCRTCRRSVVPGDRVLHDPVARNVACAACAAR